MADNQVRSTDARAEERDEDRRQLVFVVNGERQVLRMLGYGYYVTLCTNCASCTYGAGNSTVAAEADRLPHHIAGGKLDDLVEHLEIRECFWSNALEELGLCLCVFFFCA